VTITPHVIHKCKYVNVHAHMWHDPSIRVTWLIQPRDTTYLDLWSTFFVYVTWRIHACSYTWCDR